MSDLKNIPKSKRGGAYLMVLTITMLMLIVVAIALSITAISRRLTSLYAYNIGLYDLALSGNEQILFLVNEAWENQSDNVKLRVLIQIANAGLTFTYDNGFRIPASYGSIFRNAFISEAMKEIQQLNDNMFEDFIINQVTWNQFSWDLELVVGSQDQDLRSFYRAHTILRLDGNYNRFIVRTNIRKYVDSIASFPLEVEASIIWAHTGYREISLNAHTIHMLELQEVYFTVQPNPGDIIFLDEFTLTMVESWRNDITRRDDPWGS